MVLLSGQMVVSTLVNGSRESNMGLVRISARKAYRRRESGKMAEKLGGLGMKGFKMTFRMICNEYLDC
jgi:hypothetical protein